MKNIKPILGITFLIVLTAVVSIGGLALSRSDSSIEGAYSFYDGEEDGTIDLNNVETLASVLSSDPRFEKFYNIIKDSAYYEQLQENASAITLFVFSNNLVDSLALTEEDTANYMIGSSIDADTLFAYPTPQHFSSLGGSTLKIATDEGTDITYLNDTYVVTSIGNYINGNLFFIEN